MLELVKLDFFSSKFSIISDKKLSEYSSELTFKSLPYEIDLISKDTALGDKRKRWHKNLSKDIYVNEALNVLNDLRLSYIEK